MIRAAKCNEVVCEKSGKVVSKADKKKEKKDKKEKQLKKQKKDPKFDDNLNNRESGNAFWVKLIYISRNTRVQPASVLLEYRREWALDKLSYQTRFLNSSRDFRGLNRDAHGSTLVPCYIAKVVDVSDEDGGYLELCSKVRKTVPVSLAEVRTMIEEMHQGFPEDTDELGSSSE